MPGLRLAAAVCVLVVCHALPTVTHFRQQTLEPSHQRFASAGVENIDATDWPEFSKQFLAVGRAAAAGVKNWDNDVYVKLIKKGMSAFKAYPLFSAFGSTGGLPVLKPDWRHSVMVDVNTEGTAITRDATLNKGNAIMGTLWSAVYKGFYADVLAKYPGALNMEITHNGVTTLVETTPIGFVRAQSGEGEDGGSKWSKTTQYAMPTALRTGTKKLWTGKVTHNVHRQVLKVGTTVTGVLVRHGIIGLAVDDVVPKQDHVDTALLVLNDALPLAPKSFDSFTKGTTTVAPKHRVVFNSLLVNVVVTKKAEDKRLSQSQFELLRSAEFLQGATTAGAEPALVFNEFTTLFVNERRPAFNVAGYAMYTAWLWEDVAKLAHSLVDSKSYATAVPTNFKAWCTAKLNGKADPSVNTFLKAELGTPADVVAFAAKMSDLSRTIATTLFTRPAADWFDNANAFDTAADTQRKLVKGFARLAREFAHHLYGTQPMVAKGDLLDAAGKLRYHKVVAAAHLLDVLLTVGASTSGTGDVELSFTKQVKSVLANPTGKRLRKATLASCEALAQYCLSVVSFMNCKSGCDRTSLYAARFYATHHLLHTEFKDNIGEGIVYLTAHAVNYDRVRWYYATQSRDYFKTYNPVAHEQTHKCSSIRGKWRSRFHKDTEHMLIDKRAHAAPGNLAMAEINALTKYHWVYRSYALESMAGMSANIDMASTGLRGLKFEVNPNVGETIAPFVQERALPSTPAVVYATSQRGAPSVKAFLAAFGKSYEYMSPVGDALIQDYGLCRKS